MYCSVSQVVMDHPVGMGKLSVASAAARPKGPSATVAAAIKPIANDLVTAGRTARVDAFFIRAPCSFFAVTLASIATSVSARSSRRRWLRRGTATSAGGRGAIEVGFEERRRGKRGLVDPGGQLLADEFGQPGVLVAGSVDAVGVQLVGEVGVDVGVRGSSVEDGSHGQRGGLGKPPHGVRSVLACT
jgi:hypothetical protein